MGSILADVSEMVAWLFCTHVPNGYRQQVMNAVLEIWPGFVKDYKTSEQKPVVAFFKEWIKDNKGKIPPVLKRKMIVNKLVEHLGYIEGIALRSSFEKRESC